MTGCGPITLQLHEVLHNARSRVAAREQQSASKRRGVFCVGNVIFPFFSEVSGFRIAISTFERWDLLSTK